MGKVIIVEGIDRVGKTTLCQLLSKKLNIPVFKYVPRFPRTEKMNDEMTDALITMVKTTNCDVIFDRLHASECVYSSIEKRRENFEPIWEFDKRLAKMGAIIAFVKPTDIEWSSKKHGTSLVEHEHKFEAFMRLTSCPVFTCDFNSLDGISEVIRKYFDIKGEN